MDPKYEYPRIVQIMPCEEELYVIYEDLPEKFERVYGWALVEEYDENMNQISTYVNPLIHSYGLLCPDFQAMHIITKKEMLEDKKALKLLS